MQRKLSAKWLNVVFLRSRFSPAVGCRWVSAWCRSGLWGFSFFFFCFSSYSRRRPKERSLSACDRGRHIPAPGREGRRVGSSGHRPKKNENFRYPLRRSLVKYVLFLVKVSLWYAAERLREGCPLKFESLDKLVHSLLGHTDPFANESGRRDHSNVPLTRLPPTKQASVFDIFVRSLQGHTHCSPMLLAVWPHNTVMCAQRLPLMVESKSCVRRVLRYLWVQFIVSCPRWASQSEGSRQGSCLLFVSARLLLEVCCRLWEASQDDNGD